ncbi:hypothetical protein JCM10213_002520 [Rhodosporidiobolus nylandii]
MLVYVDSSTYAVTLEDNGAFLHFFQPGSKAQVQVRFFSPGDEKPALDNCMPNPVDARGCLGVLALSKTTYVVVAVPPVNPVGLESDEVEQIEEVLFFDLNGTHLPFARTPIHPCYHIRQQLVPGSFYYSKTFDLTTRFEHRVKLQNHRDAACSPQSRTDPTSAPPPLPPWHAGAPEFTWNHFLLEPLGALRDSLSAQEQAYWDSRFFALPVIQGCYEDAEVVVKGQKMMLTVLSRRTWGRAGTRFAKRGIDDDGNVGNFAETETILSTPDKTIAFVQVRGSVPLKWQERPHWHGGIDVTISEPLEVISLHPFLKHFDHLLASYKKVHILSLLSDQTTGPMAPEGHLGAAYEALVEAAAKEEPDFAKSVAFDKHDLHSELLTEKMMKVPEELAELAETTLEEFGATVASFDEKSGRYTLEKEQQGTYRVNCRDCLDRTTMGEFSLSRAALAAQMAALDLPALFASPVEEAHRHLFADNGDALSFIYAGSPAMNSTFIKTGQWTPKQSEENAVNSMKRKIQCAEHDKTKNKALEILTGQRVSIGKQPPPPLLVRVDYLGQPIPAGTSSSSSSTTATQTAPGANNLPSQLAAFLTGLSDSGTPVKVFRV